MEIIEQQKELSAPVEDHNETVADNASIDALSQMLRQGREEASLTSSINWLGRHVPICVMDRVAKEVSANYRDGSKNNLIERNEILSDLWYGDDYSSSSSSNEENNQNADDDENDGDLSDLSDEEANNNEDNKVLKRGSIVKKKPLDLIQEESGEEDDDSFSHSEEEESCHSSISDKPYQNGGTDTTINGNIENITKDTNIEVMPSKPIEQNTPLPQLQSTGGVSQIENIQVLLPSAATKQRCAMLFVDISGFTKLSKALDPEPLSVTINDYFQMIVGEVTSHGGDVLKFAGDALFAEFRQEDINDKSSSHFKYEHDDKDDEPASATNQKPHKTSIEDCVALAAICGAHIVTRCSDYPVYTDDEKLITTLNVHCGLGVGETVGVHVGDNKFRREYLVLGDPIRQCTEAADNAILGELRASKEALLVMSRKCDLVDELQTALSSVTTTENGNHNSDEKDNKRYVLIATKSSVFFQPPTDILENQCQMEIDTHMFDEWDLELLHQFRDLIALYAHPVVVDNDLVASEVPLRRQTLTIQERRNEEAELRNIYTMFICMSNVKVEITGNPKRDGRLLRLLNKIMNLVARELQRFNGHLRQFIVDDKGLVMIATFGLRGSSYPNMVTERALPATLVIHNDLESELGVTNKIGATIGDAYCGTVGGIKRHEYAVLGPSVNLAARLMASPKNPGILVDDAIRLKAGKSYSFNSLGTVQAKGFLNPVPIFEPLSALERGWGEIIKNFVGRKHEMSQLLGIAKDMKSQRNCPAKIVCATGDTGVGKSATIVKAVEQIRKQISRNRKRVLVAKHSCKEGDNLVPFSMLRSLLPDLMMSESYQTKVDEDSSMSTRSNSVIVNADDMEASNHSLEGRSIDWDNASFASAASSVSALFNVHSSPDRLMKLCIEMDAPPEFMDLVGHHLLGLDMESINRAREAAGQEKSKGKPPSPQATVDFMAQAFQLCSKRSRLTVVALDNVQYMDEMSWSVLQKLFITTPNVLILCTSREFDSTVLTIHDQFFKDLMDKYQNQGRFVPMTLGPFKKKEIRSLMAKDLDIKEEEIPNKLCHNIHRQCNGMPHFTLELLEIAKRTTGEDAKGVLAWLQENSSTSASSFATLNELILHRVDSFDAYVRDVLNLGAVLGTSFVLMEITAVSQQFTATPQSEKAAHNEQLHKALDFLVKERVLRQFYEGGEESRFEEHFMVGLDDSRADLKDMLVDDSSRGTMLSHNLGSSSGDGRVFTFCHDVWRQSLLHLMLDSRKRDLHRIIATTLEEVNDNNNRDFSSRVKLFTHWKDGGDFPKAASLALEIGKSFEEQGLHNQSIQVYEDSLEKLRGTGDSEDIIGGFDTQVIEKLSVTDLEYIIKIHIAMGKCFANLLLAAESVDAYQNALEILQFAPAAHDIEDRTIVFPIFSGLFVALKFGQIEQDEECTYEQNLVSKFVNETYLSGDPVHYTRALAMQGEVFGRLGHFEKALEAHGELVKVYNVDEHSKGICKAYGSDRSGQSFSTSALWQVQLGDVEGALCTCRYVVEELMPKMEPRNVHNSCIMLYPVIFIMKDNGLALEAREIFVKHVVDCFNEHYGEGASTFCLALYKPLMMLLDLHGNQDEDLIGNEEEYVEWALNEDNLHFKPVLNSCMSNFGRCANSLSSEICLLLADRIGEMGLYKKLLKNGLMIAQECIEFTESKGMIISYKQVEPILKELETLSNVINKS